MNLNSLFNLLTRCIKKVPLIFLLTILSLPAQNSLEITLIDNTVDANESDFVDMDLDGDLDILVSATNNHQILWYEQTDDLIFEKHVIDFNDESFPQSAVALDFDSDGDIDVLSVGFDNYVHLFSNGGDQNFTKSIFAGFQTISNDDILYFPNKIESTDLNNDGINDFVISQAEDFIDKFGEILIYKSNLSTGLYETHLIDTVWTSESNYFGDFFDFNNDGFVDIIFNVGQEKVLV